MKHGDQGRAQPKTLTPSAKREAIRIMTAEHGLPIVRACQVARLSRAAYYKPGWIGQNTIARSLALQAIVVEEQRWGFWKCHDASTMLWLEPRADLAGVLPAASTVVLSI